MHEAARSLQSDSNGGEEGVVVEEVQDPLGEEAILKYVLLAEECEPELIKAHQKEYFATLEKEYKQIKRALATCAAAATSEYISYALRIIGMMQTPLPIYVNLYLPRLNEQILVCDW